MTDWQPIETAPKDGKWVLLRSRFDEDQMACWGKFHLRWEGAFSPPEFGWMDEEGEYISDATGWKPLSVQPDI